MNSRRLLERPAARWAALLGGALVWRLVLWSGPQASDDLMYSERAWSLLTGTYPFAPDIFTQRLGYLALMAASYGLFGAGEFTLGLTNLASSLAGIVLAQRIVRRLQGETEGWIAAGALAVLPLDVYCASEAHTDLPLAVLISAAVLVVLRAKDAGTWRSFLAAGLLLGAGHLVKESAFFGFAALAAVAGRPRRIWGWAAAGFLAVVLAECLFYLAATGDPLFRVHAIRTMQTEDIDAMLSEVSVPGRLLASVAGLFVPGTGAWVFFGPLPLLALAGAVLAWRRREAGLRPAAVWTGVVLALLLFWPITLWPYRPALRAPARIFLAVEIPLAALAASLLARLKRPANWAVAAAAVAVAVPCSWAIHADARRHSAGAALAYRHLPPGLPVITDPRTKPLFRLFDGYRNPNRWLTWSDPPVAGSHLRVVNQRGLSMDREWGGAPPPSGFVGKEGETVFEGSVPGRLRLRGLLAGRAERGASESVAVYRIAP